jgi:pilus assembly protein Flp/PilA
MRSGNDTTDPAAGPGLARRAWGHLVERWHEDDGVTAIEYGLLAALIAVACVAAFSATGTSLSAIYTTWSQAVVAAL